MPFGTLGGWEWIIILVIVIIVFGVGKLPQVGGALGKSIREFRDASTNSKNGETGESPDQGKVAPITTAKEK